LGKGDGFGLGLWGFDWVGGWDLKLAVHLCFWALADPLGDGSIPSLPPALFNPSSPPGEELSSRPMLAGGRGAGWAGLGGGAGVGFQQGCQGCHEGGCDLAE